MRRLKRDRGKPIPVSDLQQIAKFRAELTVANRLKEDGLSDAEVLRRVFGDDNGES